MFKNYLTYNLALSFHRSCATLEGTREFKERLLKSSEIMIHHFAKSIHATDRKDEAKNLFVTLISLRDCRDILEENRAFGETLVMQYAVLHARMEQLCLEAAGGENGQLRMLG